ncbi:MAG: phosphoglucosamine mutase [Thermococci archaeon]|nr:phosphoglucosamine mutase [Thermococci archaeon]
MRLFGTAGIRGPLWEKISPDLALKIGMALGTYLDSGTVCAGMDGRTSSPMLMKALSSGLLSAGSRVLNFGPVPTPALAWGTRKRGDAGVMITASHNPPTDNGVKVFNGDGTEFYREQEEELEGIIESGRYRRAGWDEVGDVESVDVIDDYTHAVLDFAGHETSLRILYDGANGVGSLVAPYLLGQMGAKVFSVNSHVDGHFPGRKPEPRYENLTHLGALVRELGADLAIAQDGDADRIAVFDDRGKYVEEDTLIALFAKLYVEETGGDVVVSINTGSRIDDVVEAAGGRVHRVPLGQLHDGIKRYSAVFAAEPWKFIHPKFGPWIDSFVTMALLIKLIDDTGEPLSRLVEGIPKYHIKKANVPCPDYCKSAAVAEAASTIERNLGREIREVLTVSGFRFNLDDGSWVLVRASGTEPKVRVVVEARDRKRLSELFERVYESVSNAVRRTCGEGERWDGLQNGSRGS